GKELPWFPIDVEVHPNSFLKTLLEAGVAQGYAFTHQRRRRTLRGGVDSAPALFPPAQGLDPPHIFPWAPLAFSKTTTPLRGRWTNAWGEPVDFAVVVERALRLLEEASLPLAQTMREDKPESGKAPVHTFTCGGTHMVYGLLSAVHAGYTGRDR